MENTDVLIKGGNILKFKVEQAISCSKKAHKNEADKFNEIINKYICFTKDDGIDIDNIDLYLSFFWKMYETIRSKSITGVYFLRNLSNQYITIDASQDIINRVDQLKKWYRLERVVYTAPSDYRILRDTLREYYQKDMVVQTEIGKMYDIKNYNDFYTNFSDVIYQDKIIVNHNFYDIIHFNTKEYIGWDKNTAVSYQILGKEDERDLFLRIKAMVDWLDDNSLRFLIPIEGNNYIALCGNDNLSDCTDVYYEYIYDDYNRTLAEYLKASCE